MKNDLPKIVARGLLSKEDAHAAIAELDLLCSMPQARILCPTLIEIVLEK